MRIILSFLFCLLNLSAQDDKKTDFLRVQENEKLALLQTAITPYHKGSQHVTLIGAVHLADQDYFKDLNQHFQSYDCILFEMIGGDNAANLEKKPESKEGVAQMYQILGNFLNLSQQRTAIDYTSKNFVHADLTSAEFKKLQKDKGESLLGFGKAHNQNDSNFQKLMDALLSGDSNKVKLQLIGDLGQGDEQIDTFAGKSVIINDRNTKALQVLEKAMEQGHLNIGIFYGAAHFPDLEKKLLIRGFKKGEQRWLNAWSVEKSGNPKE